MKIKSILTEIDSISKTKNKSLLVESRANHLISSAINLFQFINENFSEEQEKVLERKLFNAIRSRNPEKFTKAVQRPLDENKWNHS